MKQEQIFLIHSLLKRTRYAIKVKNPLLKMDQLLLVSHQRKKTMLHQFPSNGAKETQQLITNASLMHLKQKWSIGIIASLQKTPVSTSYPRKAVPRMSWNIPHFPQRMRKMSRRNWTDVQPSSTKNQRSQEKLRWIVGVM